MPLPIDLDVRSIKQMLDSGEKFVLLDCREPDEVATAKIAGDDPPDPRYKELFRPRVPRVASVRPVDGVTPAAMRKLNEAVKGSRYVELPGAGHISNMDQPQGFTRAIQEFLKAA